LAGAPFLSARLADAVTFVAPMTALVVGRISQMLAGD
jgi:hypothetical protein